ncbi:hypothetical protein [Pedobacter psychrodurus]|uniref:hypothetical protein n=1 Tax=Pedobacter psychrodurus TaxID=2530456 RepID=UPI00292F2553|nr:hypothetical protein [Pedobacter psychrodurus]
MDQKNLEYLQKTLDYLGFGTRLNEVLESAVYRGLDRFSLGINQRYIPGEFRSDPAKGVDQMRFEINFSKAKETGVYFLNSYEGSLIRYNTSEPVMQRFELERDNRMSALQCYKLLCGLSLQKEILVKNTSGSTEGERERVPVWFRLDLSVTGNNGNHPVNKFFPGYGYDLEQSIGKYPFKGLEDEEKKQAVTKALRYGNLVELSLSIDGKEHAVYVAANPRLKTLDIYSKDMQQLRDNQIFSSQKAEGQNTPRAFEGILPPPQVAKQFPWKQQGGDKEPKIGR